MTVAAMPQPSDGLRQGGALKLHRTSRFGEVSIASLAPKSPEKQAGEPPAEGAALYYLRLGVTADSTHPGRRGGARNRADRESTALTGRQVANLIAAAGHARAIGLPFTRMVTIHWEAAGVPPLGLARATGRFLDLLSKALARHGAGSAWLWVHESGVGKGAHCHLLAHVPPDLVKVISRLQAGWLRRITGRPYKARVIHSKPIGGRLGLETGNPALHARNAEAALGYLLKGADADARTAFELARHEPGGRILGKRCGTSQNIGAGARERSRHETR